MMMDIQRASAWRVGIFGAAFSTIIAFPFLAFQFRDWARSERCVWRAAGEHSRKPALMSSLPGSIRDGQGRRLRKHGTLTVERGTWSSQGCAGAAPGVSEGRAEQAWGTRV